MCRRRAAIRQAPVLITEEVYGGQPSRPSLENVSGVLQADAADRQNRQPAGADGGTEGLDPGQGVIRRLAAGREHGAKDQ